MVAVVRRWMMRVLANGMDIPRVTSVRIQRGMDQDFAKAQFTVGYPAHGQLKKGSIVQIILGINNQAERFVGFIADPGTNLWPGRITFDCIDIMGYLANYFPPGDVEFGSQSDIDIINSILDFAQIPVNMRQIDGVGDSFGDFGEDVPGLEWPQLQSALEAIKEIDSMSLGFRTYARSNGLIVRHAIPTIPGQIASFLFEEGDGGVGGNIMSGGMNVSEYEPTTEVSIFTNDGQYFTAVSAGNPYAWLDRPFARAHAAIQNVNATPGFITSENIAQYCLGKMNRNLVKVQFTTEVDDIFDVVQTIRVDSVHMYVVQNFYLQNLSIDAEVDGKFRQTIVGVSELMDNPDGFPVQVAFGPNAGQTLTPTPSTLTPPSNADVFSAFTITAIDKEKLADDTYMYIVSCSNMSTSAQGTITTLAWTASGPGVVVTAGSEQQFTTGFTDLSTAQIELTVTDSNGNTNASMQRPDQAGVPIRIRKLYTITATEFEAFDGEDWNTHTPSNAEPMSAVAHGPYAAAGDMLLYTLDDLHTPANEVVIQSGIDISAIWVEPDANQFNVAAGFVDGSVAVSADQGATWTVTPQQPDTDAIRRIIISRFVAGEIHAITNSGYYVSDNNGFGWRLIKSGDFIDLQLSHSRNVLVTSVGTLITAVENPDPFNFPSLSPSVFIVAATAHIRQDKFYAIDSQGRTFQQFGELSGSFDMLQAVDIPEGTGQDRGAYRDGLLVDMVYFATGISLWKTIDGFRTSGGYLKLR